MSRPIRKPEDLARAYDHLHYEIWMFTITADLLASTALGEGPLENAILESWVIHARNLLDFLYRPERVRDDTVIAEDFIPTDTWLQARPEKSDRLKLAHARAHKEIAHLTYDRREVTPEIKLWPFVEISRDVEKVFGVFMKLANRKLPGDVILHPSVKHEAGSTFSESHGIEFRARHWPEWPSR